MPTRIDPTSHEGRVNLLTTAIATATSDRAANRTNVPQQWITDATPLLTTYRAKVTALNAKMGKRRDEIAERDAQVAMLEKYVRHGWAVLEMRIDRLGLPAGLRDLYGVPASKSPYLTPQEWVTKAQTFISGDAAAETQGQNAMTNPSAEEIQAILTVAQAEIADVSDAVAELDAAQETAQIDVPKVMELIADLYAYLEFGLRKESPASQRQEMRRYGVQYKYLPGEPVEEDGGKTE